MKRSWQKIVLSCVAYFIVGGISLMAAVYLSTRFLMPALAQTNTAETDSNPSEEAPLAETPALGESATEPREIPPAGQENKSQSELSIDNLNKFLRVYEYDPGGRRDPFQPFVENQSDQNYGDDPSTPIGTLTPLERFDLDQIELLGIIWQVSKPKAMMRDPTGRVHIVGRNAKIGRNNGYIAVIREGELVVVESFEDRGNITYQTRIMKISR